MSDVVRALAISSTILLSVVVFIIFISMAAVRRGELGGAEAEHRHPDPGLAVKETVAAVKGGKAAAATADEISVPNILLLGLGMFVLSVLALFGLSLLMHLR